MPFQKGNPGGGRPKKSEQEKYRAYMLRTVGPERFKVIVGALAAKAEGGDVQAAKVLIEQIMGKPAQRIDVQGDLAVTKGYAKEASPDDWPDPDRNVPG